MSSGITIARNVGPEFKGSPGMARALYLAWIRWGGGKTLRFINLEIYKCIHERQRENARWS